MFHCGDVSPGGGGKWSEDCNSVSLRDAWRCPHPKHSSAQCGEVQTGPGKPWPPFGVEGYSVTSPGSTLMWLSVVSRTP